MANLSVSAVTSGAEKSAMLVNAKAYGYFLKKDYSSALNMYKRAISIHPRYAPFYDGIGDVYLKMGNYGQAYANYSTASKLLPSNSLYKIHAHKAIYESYSSQIAEAKYMLAKASELSSGNSRVTSNILNLNNYNLKNLEYITDIYQNVKDLNLSKGNAAFWLDKHPQAVKFYIESTKSKKFGYQAYNNLGLLYLNNNSFNNAISYIKQSIKKNPNSYIAYNNLGIVHAKKKSFESADKYFGIALGKNAKYYPAYNNKAVARLNYVTAKMGTSIKFLETILGYEPHNLAAVNLLADFYKLRSDYERAVKIYEPNIKNISNNSRLLKEYADMLLHVNRYNDALEFYRKASSINNEDSEVFLGMARAYEKLGSSKEAFWNYKNAIRVNPKNHEAYKHFIIYLKNENRTSEINGMLGKYMEISPKFNQVVLKRILEE